MSLNRFVPLQITQSGLVPTASAMEIGELATNTVDNYLFMRSGSNVVLMAAGVAISSSYAVSASYAPSNASNPDWSTVTNKPTGLVSSSTQITSVAQATTASVLTSNNTTTWTTPSLAAQATYTSSISLQSNRSIIMLSSGSVYSRIQLYNNTTNQTADLGRSTGSFASASSGLLLDIVHSGSTGQNGQIVLLSPPATVYGYSTFPTQSLAITITNLTNTTQALSGSLVYMSL